MLNDDDFADFSLDDYVVADRSSPVIEPNEDAVVVPKSSFMNVTLSSDFESKVVLVLMSLLSVLMICIIIAGQLSGPESSTSDDRSSSVKELYVVHQSMS